MYQLIKLLSSMLSTFLVTLREGVEAALVVGIVLAFLSKHASHLKVWAWWGLAGGMGASGLVGGALQLALGWAEASSPLGMQVLQTILGTVAIASLSWMLLWMAENAKTLKGEIETQVAQRLSGWGVLLLVLVAIAREGFEIVLFIYSQFTAGYAPLVGGIAGVIGAGIIGYGIFGLGLRLNLRAFFRWLGVLLLFLLAGLVISTLYHLDRAVSLWHPELCSSSGSCILGLQVWDTHEFLPDRQFPGVILKTLLGYRDHLYLLQAIAYGIFLTAGLRLYWQRV
jgi:high-affinity iron transporter